MLLARVQVFVSRQVPNDLLEFPVCEWRIERRIVVDERVLPSIRILRSQKDADVQQPGVTGTFRKPRSVKLSKARWSVGKWPNRRINPRLQNTFVDPALLREVKERVEIELLGRGNGIAVRSVVPPIRHVDPIAWICGLCRGLLWEDLNRAAIRILVASQRRAKPLQRIDDRSGWRGLG